jgi:probable rRNA maturation factor
VTYEIEFQNEAGYAINEARLREAVAATLDRHSAAPNTALSIVSTNDDAIRDLNRQYRQVDSPTDVLSFPADAPPVQIPDEPPYLGDLVVAYPYAAAQAQREGHSLDDSLALLLVHGALHLLGYDHDTRAQREIMWAAQANILESLNIPLDIVPALEGDAHDESSAPHS